MNHTYFNSQARHRYKVSSIALFFLMVCSLASCRLSISESETEGSTIQGPGCADVICTAPMVCVEPSGECKSVCDNDISCVNNDPCQTIVSQQSSDSEQADTAPSICESFTCNAGGFLSCQLFDPCMIDSCDAALGCSHESVTEVECAADEVCVSEIPLGSTYPGRLGDCAKRCTQESDCDDSDDCTNDVCETNLLSTSATEGLCANATIDSCMLLGACCTKEGCFELSEPDCVSQFLGEVYQGDGTTCSPSPCFGDFMPGSYALSGDCPGDGTTVTLAAEANTLFLRGLSENDDIPLALNGSTATATDLVVSGVGDQNATLSVLVDGSILLDISSAFAETSCRSTMLMQ